MSGSEAAVFAKDIWSYYICRVSPVLGCEIVSKYNVQSNLHSGAISEDVAKVLKKSRKKPSYDEVLSLTGEHYTLHFLSHLEGESTAIGLFLVTSNTEMPSTFVSDTLQSLVHAVSLQCHKSEPSAFIAETAQRLDDNLALLLHAFHSELKKGRRYSRLNLEDISAALSATDAVSAATSSMADRSPVPQPSHANESIRLIKDEIDATKKQVHTAIDRTIDRGENLEQLEMQSNQLLEGGDMFRRRAVALRRRMRWRNLKLWLLIAFIVLVIVAIIVFAIWLNADTSK